MARIEKRGLAELRTWEDELERLADEAKGLIERERQEDKPLMQERIALSQRAFSYLFLGLTPRVIARSCRLAVAMGEPVICTDPLDRQVLELRTVRRTGALTTAPDEVGDAPLEAVPDDPPIQVIGSDPVPAPEPQEAPEDAAKTPRGSRWTGKAGENWMGLECVAALLDTTPNTVRAWVYKQAKADEVDSSNRRRMLVSPEMVERYRAKRRPGRSKPAPAEQPQEPPQEQPGAHGTGSDEAAVPAALVGQLEALLAQIKAAG
ncbi:MAG: hypothetical protein VKM98_10015 [Cyanobacteriota bacterium]|nr:hypothetical protein [Cyanobacteriota bacterium]